MFGFLKSLTNKGTSGARRKGWLVKKTSGRLRGRTCVVVDAEKRTPGFKGKGSTRRYYGCFNSSRGAAERLAQLVRMPSLPKGKHRRRKKSKR